jgi:hypothetical protein
VSYKDAPTTTVDVDGIPFTYRQVAPKAFIGRSANDSA